MLSAFVIALREGVEASLIVGILVAYLVKAGRKDVLKNMWIGVAIAVIVPAALGAIMTWGPSTLTFNAQEFIGGTLSLIAVGFVTWMIFWMGKNAHSLSKELREAAESALESGSAMGIAWLAILAVGREGLETALFIWPTVKSGVDNGNGAMPIMGLILGLAAAVVIGYLVYKGSVRINLRSFFTVTGYLLIVVAAGIAAYGLKDLQESGVIPGHGHTIYNFTSVIADHASSWWFTLLDAFFQLQVLMGPTLLQFLGWAIYLVVCLSLFTRQIRGKTSVSHQVRNNHA
jgi:hypothetical protein